MSCVIIMSAFGHWQQRQIDALKNAKSEVMRKRRHKMRISYQKGNHLISRWFVTKPSSPFRIATLVPINTTKNQHACKDLDERRSSIKLNLVVEGYSILVGSSDAPRKSGEGRGAPWVGLESFECSGRSWLRWHFGLPH